MLRASGYQLIETESNTVVQSWGGSYGVIIPPPAAIVLPNGDQVCGAKADDEFHGFKLILWMKEPDPEPIPVISRRQFFQQAAIKGSISQEEALQSVKTGAIPNVLQTLIDSIEDQEQKFVASMLLSGAVSFDRSHALTDFIGQALNMTNEEIDQFFRDASLL